MTSFTSEFHTKINAKYSVKAVPQRVDYFTHDLHDPIKNKEFVTWLASKEHETLFLNKEGELRLYDTAFVFLDTENKVVFFYTFHPIPFNNHSAIQEDHIETFKQVQNVKIEGLPLGAYCLFKVLIPRYKTVIGADQHTPDGERWSKRQVKEAIDKGFHVYLINEKGTLYNAATFKEVEIRTEYLWGWDEEHRSRLVIISSNHL